MICFVCIYNIIQYITGLASLVWELVGQILKKMTHTYNKTIRRPQVGHVWEYFFRRGQPFIQISFNLFLRVSKKVRNRHPWKDGHWRSTCTSWTFWADITQGLCEKGPSGNTPWFFDKNHAKELGGIWETYWTKTQRWDPLSGQPGGLRAGQGLRKDIQTKYDWEHEPMFENGFEIPIHDFNQRCGETGPWKGILSVADALWATWSTRMRSFCEHNFASRSPHSRLW